MTKEQIKHMVDRFLGWKLPENFNPDAGISFKATFNEYTAHPMKNEPTGTNLFDATQADAMVRYMLEGMPPEKAHEAVGDNVCPQGPSFHWRNGWMFARGEANYIHVWNIERGIDLCISPDEWASIVKSLDQHNI